MSVIATSQMIQISLEEKLITVQIVKEGSKAQKHSSCDQPELEREFQSVLQFVFLDGVVFVHDQ